MSNKDIAVSVNTFMLNSAPTLTEASPMAYDLLKSLAYNLVFYVKTTREHALGVMIRKYGHIYTTPCLSMIINEAFSDEINQRMRLRQVRKEREMVSRAQPSQPVLLAV
jgi:hypothetical protein